MKLIDKCALVAEITHKIKVLEAFIKNFDGISDKVEKAKNKIEALGDTLLFIDTLEAKKVDLEKEISNYISNNFFGSQTIGFYANRTKEEPNDRDIALVAKYFFELGIMQFVNESVIRKIVDLNDEAAKHYDAVIKKENEENGFSQLAIDLFEHNVDAKELCIQYIIENLKAQKGE